MKPLTTAAMLILAARFGPERQYLFLERLGILIGTAPAAQHPEAVRLAYEQAAAAEEPV